MTDNVFDPGPSQRPDHPNFARLVEIVLQYDGKASEGHETMEKMLAGMIDGEVLAYMALQRALRAATLTGNSELARRAHVMSMLASLWFEGFVMGHTYRERYGKP